MGYILLKQPLLECSNVVVDIKLFFSSNKFGCCKLFVVNGNGGNIVLLGGNGGGDDDECC